MLSFLDYLKENGEDVTKVESILTDKWNKTITIIKEAFSDKYSNKQLALYNLENELKANKNIDSDFLSENMDYIKEKINTLSEGEIKIIINNYEAGNKKANTPVCSSVPALEPIIVSSEDGIDMSDIETESADPTKKRGRGRPPKKVVEETIKETPEVTIENKEVKPIEEIKPETTEEITKIEENKKEENMTNKNTISWKDIDGFDVKEDITEATTIDIKKGDSVVVDSNEYNVVNVTKNDKFVIVEATDKDGKVFSFASDEIDEIKASTPIKEEEEIQPIEDEIPMETTEQSAEEEISDEDKSEEEAEEDEEKKDDKAEPGDKVMIKDDDIKYLVISRDDEKNEITVENEDGEELTFSCDDVTEIEKEMEDEDEIEENDEDEVDESYDPEGNAIHDDLASAKRIFEGNFSEAMPKIPQSANVKSGSSISKVNAPQAQGLPKSASSMPTGGKSVSTVNMPKADSEPKMKEKMNKEKTANGFTQSVQKHSMPQDSGMPKADTSVPKGTAATMFNMPQNASTPKGTTLPKGDASISKVTPKHDMGMPKAPATMLESYYKRANRFLSE